MKEGVRPRPSGLTLGAPGNVGHCCSALPTWLPVLTGHEHMWSWLDAGNVETAHPAAAAGAERICVQDPTEPVCCACKQEADAGESELEGLEAVLDSCFMPALEHIDRGTSAVEALDALVVDLLSLAQSSSREREKAFAVESLESLQRQCPMSMAVTLRHYSEVYQAAQAGAAPHARQLNISVNLPICLAFPEAGHSEKGRADLPLFSGASPA